MIRKREQWEYYTYFHYLCWAHLTKALDGGGAHACVKKANCDCTLSILLHHIVIHKISLQIHCSSSYLKTVYSDHYLIQQVCISYLCAPTQHLMSEQVRIHWHYDKLHQLWIRHGVCSESKVTLSNNQEKLKRSAVLLHSCTMHMWKQRVIKSNSIEKCSPTLFLF